jgi:hypothetical protein
MHRFSPLLYSICWLLHVSAVVCHLQELLDPSELRETTDRYGGYHTMWLSGLCVGVSWFSVLCFTAV